MYKSILLTVDLNHPESWSAALPQAVELVRMSKGVLHIMSVVPDAGTPLVASFLPNDLEKKSLEHASGELDELVKAHVPKDVTVKQHLGYGRIHDEVMETIQQTQCDLVVMASHAPDTVREFLVGSNADRIVRRSPVSVLVVRT